MIDYLNNWTFFTFGLIVYMFLIILSAKLLRLFSFINSLSFVKHLASKLNNVKFISQTQSFLNTKIKPVYILAVDKIFNPVIHVSGNLLYVSSSKLSAYSLVSEEYLSGIIREGFELISLLTRKAVNADYRTVWSAVLVIIVLIYFILTNAWKCYNCFLLRVKRSNLFDFYGNKNYSIIYEILRFAQEYAAVAELVDALDSKSSEGNFVSVRVRSAVQKQ